MNKHFPFEKFEYALDLFIRNAERWGVPKAQGEPTPVSPTHVCHYEEEDLMTIKEAMAYIPASRTKIYEMRKEGALDTIERNSREKRLIRTQVEAARLWSRDKGKW